MTRRALVIAIFARMVVGAVLGFLIVAAVCAGVWLVRFTFGL